LPGQKRHRAIWGIGLIAIAALPAPAPALATPSASFEIMPANPRAGEQVQLYSSSCDPGYELWSQDWDLDGDRTSDDATGPTASVTFADPGAHLLGLRVMSDSGEVTTAWRTVVVDPADSSALPQLPPLISPFPVVTLGGRLEGRTTRINLLSVSAPSCSTVSVSCRGRGCPVESRVAQVIRRGLRLRSAEKRFRPGNRLTVAVSKGGLVGKLTEFRFRRGKPPLRTDSCLVPGATTGTPCPSD
jgi:hypothetical protein